MRRRALLPLACAVIVAGCEPERGMVAVRDVGRPLSARCVDTALRAAFPDVHADSYVSDGSGRFPAGATVRQWAYWTAADYRGTSRFALAYLGKGSRIVHAFTGAGMAIPQQDFRPAIHAMVRANAVVERSCAVDLHGIGLEEVGQRVDILR